MAFFCKNHVELEYGRLFSLLSWYWTGTQFAIQAITGTLVKDNTRQDDLFNPAQFYKTHRLNLH